MDMIQTLEREEIARLNRTIPPFAPGDTSVVSPVVRSLTYTPTGSEHSPFGWVSK